MKFGPFTGDPNKPISYAVGNHWVGNIGFFVVQGNDVYSHCFGGQNWNLPICKKCGRQIQQLFSFDLRDPRLNDLKQNGMEELPLVSCLNCSIYWEDQVYKVDADRKKLEFMIQNDVHDWVETDEDLLLPSPLPRTSVTLMDMTSEDLPVDEEKYDQAFDKLGSESICRLRGAPLYAQGPLDYGCPCCGNEMKYIATVASEADSLVMEGDFNIGESVLYYLLCLTCQVVKVSHQSL